MPKRRITVVPSQTEAILGFCFLPFQALLLGSLLARLALALHAPIDNVSLNMIHFLLSVAVVCAIFHRLLRENLRSFRAAPGRMLKAALLIGLPLYLAVSVGVNSLVEALAPGFANQNDNTVYAMLEENFVLTLLICVVFAPIVEETLYRGLIFGTLSRRSRAVGYLASAIFFSLIHVLGYLSVMTLPEVLLSLLQYLPASIMFCILYERTDCLMVPMVLHAAANLLSCVTAQFLGG